MYFNSLPPYLDPNVVVGYFRVSTDRQSYEGHALERYREDLISYGVLEHNLYWDVESGGLGAEERKGFEAVLQRCQEDAKALVVPELSRLQRSVAIGEMVKDLFIRHKVFVIQMYGGKIFDFGTAEGIKDWQAACVEAEYQRNIRSQHSCRGHARRRRRKLPNRAPFGFIVEDNQYKLNHRPYPNTNQTYYQVARDLIDNFLRLKNLAKTVTYMCEKYGYEKVGNKNHKIFPKSHEALKQWLSNPVLSGHTSYFRRGVTKRIKVFEAKVNPEIILNTHDPLISIEEKTIIDTILGELCRGRRHYKLVNPLQKKIVCKHCGSYMKVTKIPTPNKTIHYYIICRGAQPRAGDPKICEFGLTYSLELPDVIEAVISALCQKAEAIAQNNYSSDSLASPSPEVISLQDEINRLTALNIPDVAPIIAAKRQKIKDLQLESLSANVQNDWRVDQLQAFAQQPNFWKMASVEEQKIIFSELVDKVICDCGRVEVRLKI